MNKATKGQLITLPKDTLLSSTASLDPEKHRQPNVSMKIDITKASMEEKRRRLSFREKRNIAKQCVRKEVHIVAVCGIFENDNKYKDEHKFLIKTEKKNSGWRKHSVPIGTFHSTFLLSFQNISQSLKTRLTFSSLNSSLIHISINFEFYEEGESESAKVTGDCIIWGTRQRAG